MVSAKRFGFTNAMLASALRCSLSTVEQLAKSAGLAPVYKTVDTSAGSLLVRPRTITAVISRAITRVSHWVIVC